MSVKVVDRTESYLEYVKGARDLLNFTLQKCLKLPKRLTFFISTDLVKTTQDIYKDVLYIKSVYNDKDCQTQRLDACKECIARLEYLESMLDILVVYHTPFKQPSDAGKKSVVERWIDLIEKEKRLIKGIITKQS